MKEKYVITIRFHTEGVEAELYQRLFTEKQKAGLSLPEYMKQVLRKYFSEKDRKHMQGEDWKQRKEAYREMLAEMERMVRNCLNEHDAAVMGTLAKMITGSAGAGILAAGEAEAMRGMAYREETEGERIEEAALPEESEEVPEGVLDFLTED